MIRSFIQCMIQKCKFSSFTNETFQTDAKQNTKKINAGIERCLSITCSLFIQLAITMANSMNNRKRRKVDACQSTRNNVEKKMHGNFKRLAEMNRFLLASQSYKTYCADRKTVNR